MISDTFHSGPLGVAYLLCLLLSGGQSPYPATGVVPLTANTGTSGPTYTGTYHEIYNIPLRVTGIIPEVFDLYPLVTYHTQVNNLRVFSESLTSYAVSTIDEVGLVSAVLKDSL